MSIPFWKKVSTKSVQNQEAEAKQESEAVTQNDTPLQLSASMIEDEPCSKAAPQGEEAILASFMSMFTEHTRVNAAQAREIPAVSACLSFLSGRIASLPIKLYRKTSSQSVEEVTDDPRLKLLNTSTGDTLNAQEQRTAMITDYFLHGRAYLYIEREPGKNSIKSLRYVSPVHVTEPVQSDPILRSHCYWVAGRLLQSMDFLKLTRNPDQNGVGCGILKQNNLALSLTYNLMRLEELQNKTGGIKRGFFQVGKHLSTEAMTELKQAYQAMYSNSDDKAMILNEGLTFKESSNTAVEMQMNENKISNSEIICTLFGMSFDVLNGKCTKENLSNSIKTGVMPLIQALEAAMNNDLLLEDEKDTMYFAADTRELLRGDLSERINAYAKAIERNIMTIDEVRRLENLEPLGLDFIQLNLSNVFYNPKTKEFYTPNTNQTAKLDGTAIDKEGEENGEQQNNISP